MKFCCTSNAAIKMSKLQEKNKLFFQILFNEIVIFTKCTDFRILKVVPVILILIHLFRLNCKALNQLFPTLC